VEDHPVLCLGLRHILEREGMTVCGEADSITAGLACVAETSPDLAIIDISLGGEDGVALIRQLAKENSPLRILVYSTHEDATHIERSLQAGAHAYLTKREAYELLGIAIRACLAGQCYLSPMAKRMVSKSPHTGELLATLSSKEQQVYRLLGQGGSASGIALHMNLSPRTVESYFARIQVKLGLNGMKELRKRATIRPI
jgi:DNA-binding NarL/FixJ family response regulator